MHVQGGDYFTFQEDGSLLQVLGLSDRDARRAGIEGCCRGSGDSCYLLEREEDRFALAHFTGEHEYAIDGTWMDTDRAQVVSDGLQALLLTSSCSVLADMAQVNSVCFKSVVCMTVSMCRT